MGLSHGLDDPRYQARWKRIVRIVRRRDGGRCRQCQRSYRRLEVHHVRRVVDGGAPFDLANLITLCNVCHIREHRPPDPQDVTDWLAFVRKM